MDLAYLKGEGFSCCITSHCIGDRVQLDFYSHQYPDRQGMGLQNCWSKPFLSSTPAPQQRAWNTVHLPLTLGPCLARHYIVAYLCNLLCLYADAPTEWCVFNIFPITGADEGSSDNAFNHWQWLSALYSVKGFLERVQSFWINVLTP